MADPITQQTQMNAVDNTGVPNIDTFGLPIGHDNSPELDQPFPNSRITQRQVNEVTANSTSPDLLGPDQGFQSKDLAAQVQAEASQMGVIELAGQGFAPWINRGATTIARGLTPPDPNFDIKQSWDQLTNGIPDQYKQNFVGVRSLQEGMELRSQILDEFKTGRLLSANTGWSGELAGVLDFTGDPSNLIMMGLPLGKGIVQGAKINAGLAGAGQVIQGATDPTYNWAAMPQAVLFSGAVGGVAGGLFGRTALHEEVDRALGDVKAEMDGRTSTGKSPTDGPVNTDKPIPMYSDESIESQMAKHEAEFDANGQKAEDRPEFEAKMNALVEQRLQEINGKDTPSVGAASTAVRPQEPNFNKGTQALLNEVRARDAASGISAEQYDSKTYFGNSKYSQTLNKFYDWISKTPLGTDFDKLFNSDSVIAQFLGKHILESASGVGQSVNRTASILKEQYQTHVMSPVAGAYKKAFKTWLQESRDTSATEEAWNSTSKRNAFDAEVRTELHSRYFDGQKSSQSTGVHMLADAIDEASKRAVNVQKGNPGELPVRGAEDLQPKSGWFHQIWDGGQMMNTIKELETRLGINGKKAKALMQDSISEAYQDLHKWTPDIADKVSSAVMNRALSHAEGSSTQLFGMLDKDSIEFLRETLEADGNSKGAVDKIIDRIRNNTTDAGIMKSLKQRNDIDLRKTIKGTNIPLMRLTQNNVLKTWVGYSRQVSGAAGLARHGIQLSELQSKWFPAIRNELFTRGSQPMADGLLDALHSYFSGSGLSGGVSPWLRRTQQLVGLSLLDSLGLTKLSELGNVIGMIHMDNFLKAAPSELKQMFHKDNIPAMEQISSFNSSIIGDHNIYRPELMLDAQNASRAGQSELTSRMDQLLATGSRVQGFMSGFYHVQQFMQRVAGSGLLNLIHQIANGSTKVNDLRLASLGFTVKNQEAILNYFRNGTVEVKDGLVHNLNPGKWNPSDWNELASIITRSTAQGVQKSFRGEDFWWAHKSTGAAITWLKNFTLVALHKQLLRNARLADPEGFSSLTLGLGTAALAYMAKQVMNDNQDKMTTAKVFHGALKYNNITAPATDVLDPVSHFLGFKEPGFNSDGILHTPPVFDTMNRVLNIPKSLVHGAAKGLSKQDIYNLQAAPIIGSMYGMGYVVNSMKRDIDSAKHAAKNNPQEPKQEAPKASTPAIAQSQTKPLTDAQDIKKIQKMGKGE